jgi:hypothetical protein
MEHLSPSYHGSFAAIDFVFHIFGLDPKDVRDALGRVWRTRFGLREDGDMPKVVPPASNVQKFSVLEPTFQQEFDRWKAEVEKAEGGTLEISHEEIVAEGHVLVIFWRVVPRAHASRRR